MSQSCPTRVTPQLLIESVASASPEGSKRREIPFDRKPASLAIQVAHLSDNPTYRELATWSCTGQMNSGAENIQWRRNGTEGELFLHVNLIRVTHHEGFFVFETPLQICGIVFFLEYVRRLSSGALSLSL